MNLTKHQTGILSGVISIFFFSTYTIIGKVLVESIPPETISGIAQALSVILLLFMLGASPEIKKIHEISMKDFSWLFVIATLNSVLSPLLMLTGLSITTATNTIVIRSLVPIVTGIIAYFWLKEKLHTNQAIGAGLLFLGVLTIITKGFGVSLSINFGDCLVLISVLCSALATNMFKKFIPHILPDIIVLVRNTIGAFFLLIYIPIYFKFSHDFSILLDPEIAKTFIIYALITILSAQFLWYKTLELIPAIEAALITLLKPFFAFSLAVLFLKEQLFFYHFWGCTLGIIGIILTTKHKKHPKQLKGIMKLKHQH